MGFLDRLLGGSQGSPFWTGAFDPAAAGPDYGGASPGGGIPTLALPAFQGPSVPDVSIKSPSVGVGSPGRGGHDPMRRERILAALAAMQGDQSAPLRFAELERQNRALQLQEQRYGQQQDDENRQIVALGQLADNEGHPVFGKSQILAMSPTDRSTAALQRGAPFTLRPSDRRFTPNLAGGADSVTAAPPAVADQATSAGFTPGTPEYQRFVQDAVLNGQGPTGTETTRRGQDLTAAARAAANATAQRGQTMTDQRVRWQHVTPGPVRPTATRPPTPNTVIGGIMDRASRGVPLSPQENAMLQQYQARGRGRAPGRMGVSGAPVLGQGGAPAAGSAQPIPNRTASGPNGTRIQQYSDGSWRPIR